MAKIQRYQRGQFAGVQIPQTDFASLRQATTTYGAIGEMFGQMADFVNKKAEQQAIERGTRRVADVGAQQTLRQMAQQGGPANVEERQAYTLANKIAVTQLETSALSEMDELFEKAKMDKMSVNDFKIELEAIKNGYEDAMSDLDPESGMVLGERLISSGLSRLNKYNSVVNDLQLADIKQARSNSTAIYRNDYIRKAYEDGIVNEQGAIQWYVDAGWTPAEAQAMAIEDRDNVEKVLIIRDFEAIPENDIDAKYKFLEGLSDRFEYQSVEQQIQLTEGIKRDIDALAKKLESELDAENKLKIDEAYATIKRERDRSNVTGAEYNVNVVDVEALRASFKDPEDYRSFVAMHQLNMETTAITKNNANKSNSQINQDLIKAHAEYKEVDTTDPIATAVAAQKFEAIREASKEILEARAKDFAGAILSSDKTFNDQYQAAFSSILTNPDPVSSTVMVASAVTSMDKKYQALGVRLDDRRYLSKPLAEQLAGYINEIALSNQEITTQLMQGFVTATGDRAEVIIEELRRAGMNDSHAVALMHADDLETTSLLNKLSNQTVDTLIADLSDNDKKDITGDTGALNALREDVRLYNEIYEMGADDLTATQDQKNMILKEAEKMLVYYMTGQGFGRGMSGPDARKAVYAKMYPHPILDEDKVKAFAPVGKEDYGTILNTSVEMLDNSKYGRVVAQELDLQPSDIYIESAKNYINVQRANFLAEKELRERRGLSTEEYQEPNLDDVVYMLFLEDVKEGGMWINNNLSNGYALMKDGIPVRNSQGEMVEILHKDLEQKLLPLTRSYLMMDVSPYDYPKGAGLSEQEIIEKRLGIK
jgi:hypothetical protein